MTTLSMVYITCESDAQAEAIGRALVAERLAACVNLIPGMRSWYWWKGSIEAARETVLIAKTRVALVPDLSARVRQLHSYAVPCVVAIPISDGNPDYLAWLSAETGNGLTPRD
ncbi:MAG: divalent-cation tolerance protein CutA [Planctomycetes bacterium]|nr:divalent-cation tolerance protein CutA [Planctomycetota bacterium]